LGEACDPLVPESLRGVTSANVSAAWSVATP
jgi:hypothetical protein